jgi:kinetochore protein Spc25, fungi type
MSDMDVVEDVLLVRFTHLDPSDESRDFSIVIDVSDPVYKGTELLH